jgi:hypothetical protein
MTVKNERIPSWIDERDKEFFKLLQNRKAIRNTQDNTRIREVTPENHKEDFSSKDSKKD